MRPKEFMERWKKGIMQVTPEQRLKSDMFSLLFILIGCFGGAIALFITIIIGSFSWWQLFLSVLLFFSGILNISAFIEKYQTYQTFRQFKTEDFLQKGLGEFKND